MPPTLDELAPREVRQKRIDLTLSPTDDSPHANRPTTVFVSTTRTLPAGLMLPLIFEVQGPSASSYQRRVFPWHIPKQIVFTPREGGRHLVVLREAAHQRWWGSLAVDVAGEKLSR